MDLRKILADRHRGQSWRSIAEMAEIWTLVFMRENRVGVFTILAWRGRLQIRHPSASALRRRGQDALAIARKMRALRGGQRLALHLSVKSRVTY